jgi:hypothetical protein
MKACAESILKSEKCLLTIVSDREFLNKSGEKKLKRTAVKDTITSILEYSIVYLLFFRP